MRKLLFPASALTVCVLLLSACAAFRNPDGSLNAQKVDEAAHQVATTATTIGGFFGPIGAAIGGSVGAIALAYAAKLKGEAKGYDAGSLDAGKALPSSGATPAPAPPKP